MFYVFVSFSGLNRAQHSILRGKSSIRKLRKKDWGSSGQIRTHDPPSCRLDAPTTEQLLEVLRSAGRNFNTLYTSHRLFYLFEKLTDGKVPFISSVTIFEEKIIQDCARSDSSQYKRQQLFSFYLLFLVDFINSLLYLL